MSPVIIMELAIPDFAGNQNAIDNFMGNMTTALGIAQELIDDRQLTHQRGRFLSLIY